MMKGGKQIKRQNMPITNEGSLKLRKWIGKLGSFLKCVGFIIRKEMLVGCALRGAMEVGDLFSWWHTPRSVVNVNENTILWDYSIITDRKVLANRLDVVIHDRNSKSCMLIDVSVPDDKNFALKKLTKLASTRFWRSKLTGCGIWKQGRPSSRRSIQHVEKRLRKKSGVDTRTS